jgi:hypothetical protein
VSPLLSPPSLISMDSTIRIKNVDLTNINSVTEKLKIQLDVSLWTGPAIDPRNLVILRIGKS